MKPLHKKLISVCVLMVLIALAIYYIVSNASAFKQLTIVNPWLIFVLVGVFLLGYVCVCLINLILLRPLDLKLGFWESFQLSIVTGFYNLITPFRGGMAVRAVYLKKKYNFTYTNFLATLAASYVLIFLVSGLIGLLATYFIYSSSGVFNIAITLIFSTITLGMLGIIVFSPKFPETRYKFVNQFIRVINGWHLIKGNAKVIMFTTLFSLIQLLLSALMLYMQFRVFGIEVPYYSSLLISALGSLGLLIAITPAGLGIQEAITVFSAVAIGITPAESLSAALLGRAIGLVVLFILGPIFSYILLKRKRSKSIY